MADATRQFQPEWWRLPAAALRQDAAATKLRQDAATTKLRQDAAATKLRQDAAATWLLQGRSDRLQANAEHGLGDRFQVRRRSFEMERAVAVPQGLAGS